jgi:hypothetical protein
VLRDWATEEGVRIINRTRDSMIDAYEREGIDDLKKEPNGSFF